MIINECKRLRVGLSDVWNHIRFSIKPRAPSNEQLAEPFFCAFINKVFAKYKDCNPI